MFRYSESAAPPALRPWFHDVWEFAVTGEGAESHHVPPDGHTSIVVITAPWMPPQWVVSGPWIDPLVVPAHTGMVTRGLRLAVGAAPIVLGVSADCWVNRSGEMPTVPWLRDEIRAATGLTPKQFARIVRFRAAALRLVDGEVTGAQAAVGGGYADQPHFTHEVRALTGLTPKDLAHRIRRTEHHLKPE